MPPEFTLEEFMLTATATNLVTSGNNAEEVILRLARRGAVIVSAHLLKDEQTRTQNRAGDRNGKELTLPPEVELVEPERPYRMRFDSIVIVAVRQYVDAYHGFDSNRSLSEIILIGAWAETIVRRDPKSKKDLGTLYVKNIWVPAYLMPSMDLDHLKENLLAAN